MEATAAAVDLLSPMPNCKVPSYFSGYDRNFKEDRTEAADMFLDMRRGVQG